MSLLIVEEGLKHLSEQYTEKGASHAVYIECSDNSPKEFRCVGYLHGLACLAKKYKVFILKLYSVPQHGKDKCDSEGSVIKGAIRQGVAAEKIVWRDEVGYSTSIINFLKEHFENMNSPVKRTFHEIPDFTADHQKSNMKSLKGVKQYGEKQVWTSSTMPRTFALFLKCVGFCAIPNQFFAIWSLLI